MKISPVKYSMNHSYPSFGKFKDRKTARALYDYFQKEANEYQREPYFEAVRDCDYITFSTDPQTGKIIGTPRTDEEFKQSELGKMAARSIKQAVERGYFADVTGGGKNNYHGTTIADEILYVENRLRMKQENPEEYARRTTPLPKEEADKFFREERRKEREMLEDKINTWYAQ